jgi:hypothetical protein
MEYTEEEVEGYKSIISRIANDAVDELVENKQVLDSTNFMAMMEEKFERFSQLLG